MNLLFTGASGFLGNNVKPILEKQYKVNTIGLTDRDDYKVNIANEVPTFNEQFDIVLHAAGKAHIVPKTESEKQAFFDVNYRGTINLCNALEKIGLPKSFIFISTVAVYGLEYGSDITEDYPLKGESPYAKSKIMAEKYLIDWCNKHNVILSILRPSLLAGPNPPGNLGSMIKGIKTSKYLSIAGGKAKKSVLMVTDIARLVPLLAERGGIYNVCDEDNPSFGELEELISKQLGKRRPLSIPFWMAKLLALIGDCLGAKAPINSVKLEKIVKPLTFSSLKAQKELGWKPLNVLETFKIE